MPTDREEYLRRIKSAESRGNTYGKNPLSSASGLYQFTQGTWEGLGYNWKDRFNPKLQEEAVRKLTDNNAKYLQSKGITDPTSTDLYGAHWFGPEGYAKLANTSSNASVANVFSSEVLRANPNLLRPDGTPKTVGEVKGLIAQKVGGQPTQDNSPIGYTDYTLGLAPLPGQLAGYRRDVTEEVSSDPFSKLAEKQQEEDFTNEVRQQQQSQQERPQVQPNPLYSAENYQLQQFQPTQYQGQIFSEGFFQEGGITDSTGNNPKRFDELIIDYSNEDTRKKLNSKFMNIHTNSNAGCTAGSLNCLTDYVQPVLNSPSVRSMTQQNTAKYRIPSKDYLDFGNTYVPNTSIDAWEIHQQLSGENLGTNLINPKSKLTYKKNKKGVDMHQIPNELDYKKLPIGTILGQGNSAYDYTDPKLGTKSRHAMTIVGYDKKDGEPLVYDYGEIRRLSDDSGIIGAAPINNVTIPKGYEKYTYDYLKNQSKNYTTKLGYDKKTTVNYNSKKPHILAIQEGANEVKTSIGKNYGIPRDAMDKLAYFLPGISNKETGINNNETTTASKVLDNVAGNFLLKPLVKAGQNILTFGENLTKEDAPKKKLYQLEIEAYKKFPKDAVKRKNYERKLREQNDNLQTTEYKSLDSSVGPFAIKNLPQYATNKLNINKGDMYGIMNNNLGELKTGAKAALNVLAENYAKIQKKNPKLSKEELIDLTISSYNNGSKQNDPDYIRYYIKKDSKKLKDNYLEKIKGFNSFQDGGKLKFLQPTDENLPEGYVFPYATPSSERAMSIGGENGEPAYLIPSFKYGKPLGDPIQEFRKTGEHIGGPFKTWQDADKWENEIRHPAVENRQNIMFPQQEFQEGGRVKYGTPEYAEAYNKGEVVTEDGQRSPILLDEVVIQNNYKRPRGFWEQYRDKIVDENKDAGLMGAIVGTPISAITSLPQMAATYAFTDKVQRPSEAMNIRNPYGAMAVDAIADPANLIGAGILTKENALSKLGKIRTGIAPELRQGLKTAGPSFNNKEFNLQNKVQEAHNTLLDKFNTPEGKRRLALLGIDNSKLNPPNISFKSTGSGYFPTDNTMDIDLEEAIKIGIDPLTVHAHEVGHWLAKQYGDQSKTLMRQKFYQTPIDKEFIASYPENFVDELLAKNPNVDFGKISKESSAAYMLNEQDEAFPFLREMRQNMLNKGYINDEYDYISEKTINKFIKENPSYDRISSFTEPNSKQSKHIYQKFKDLPAVVPGAIGLGAASQIGNNKNTTGENKLQMGGTIENNEKSFLQEYQEGGKKVKEVKPYNFNYGKYKIEKSIMDNLGVNNFRDSVEEAAEKQGISGLHNGGLDAIRHASSAAKVSSQIPLGLGVLSANVLGLIHEISPESDWRETKSDLYNNFAGSLVGGIPFISDKTRSNILIEAQKRGYLSDLGEKDEPLNTKRPTLKKKSEGGTITDNEKAFLQEFQQGGTIPVSSNGVYDYPGQEVIVPTNSGRITMKNVNYPILGIDEYGNQQMMQSNGEYQFPGKTIHEIPQTKKKISIKSKLK